ncbi:MAG: hypothetical protein CTY20_01525 [Hyphomicrobium sp.]|nr:MAG: hypothetical protein CTY20_01525 [Hyphomicrobium sp.]
MTIRSKILHFAVAATVAFGALAHLATAASAGARKYDGGYNLEFRGHRDHFESRRYGAPHHQRYATHKKRRSSAGPAIALGIGALVLGIIASEAGRNARYSHDD